jgi:hypothetical protein
MKLSFSQIIEPFLRKEVKFVISDRREAPMLRHQQKLRARASMSSITDNSPAPRCVRKVFFCNNGVIHFILPSFTSAASEITMGSMMTTATMDEAARFAGLAFLFNIIPPLTHPQTLPGTAARSANASTPPAHSQARQHTCPAPLGQCHTRQLALTTHTS